MMGWHVHSKKTCEDWCCDRAEWLESDELEWLGSVQQFKTHSACYANSKYARLGAYSTFEEARTAVERSIETGCTRR